jgi:hypothetical protein
MIGEDGLQMKGWNQIARNQEQTQMIASANGKPAAKAPTIVNMYA